MGLGFPVCVHAHVHVHLLLLLNAVDIGMRAYFMTVLGQPSGDLNPHLPGRESGCFPPQVGFTSVPSSVDYSPFSHQSWKKPLHKNVCIMPQ